MFFLGTDFFDKVLFPLFPSYNAQTYYGIIIFLVIAVILCSLLASIAYLFSLSSVQDSEKRSEYECGFEPFDSATRLPFDVHFYLVGILFLIFDVEIALLVPWVLGLRTSGWFGFYLVLGFIVLLGVGFLYEWKRGALIWPSRQQESPYTAGLTKYSAAAVVLPELGQEAFTSFFAPVKAALLPEIFLALIITYLLAILAIEMGNGRSKKLLALESLPALREALSYVMILYAVELIHGTASYMFSGYAQSNSYTIAMKLLTVICGYYVLVNSEKFLYEHPRHLLEYPIVMVLAILFMTLLVGAAHLISAFIALIGFSLNLYVLILFDAPSAMAREAGIKYFYLSAFSSGLMLYGIFLLFFVFGTGHFRDMNQIILTNSEILSSGYRLLLCGVIFLLIGLFFKLSAFPGHLWAPEVYEGSPDPITIFFMLPVKVAALSFTIQLLVTGLQGVSAIWQPIISFGAGGSLVWGCLGALTEKKTKRFLAYASINQIGFLLMGLATTFFEGYRSTILYLALYAVMNIGFLLVFLNARRPDNNGLLYLTDFRGLGQQHWLLSWTTAMVFLSMAGIPPLAGFFGKYYLLLHTQEQGLSGLVIVGLVTSLISAYYYLRIVKILWFEGQEAMTPISCKLPVGQTTTLYFMEGFLWVFIAFIGFAFNKLDVVTGALFCVPLCSSRRRGDQPLARLQRPVAVAGRKETPLPPRCNQNVVVSRDNFLPTTLNVTAGSSILKRLAMFLRLWRQDIHCSLCEEGSVTFFGAIRIFVRSLWRQLPVVTRLFATTPPLTGNEPSSSNTPTEVSNSTTNSGASSNSGAAGSGSGTAPDAGQDAARSIASSLGAPANPGDHASSAVARAARAAREQRRASALSTSTSSSGCEGPAPKPANSSAPHFDKSVNRSAGALYNSTPTPPPEEGGSSSTENGGGEGAIESIRHLYPEAEDDPLDYVWTLFQQPEPEQRSDTTIVVPIPRRPPVRSPLLEFQEFESNEDEENEEEGNVASEPSEESSPSTTSFSDWDEVASQPNNPASVDKLSPDPTVTPPSAELQAVEVPEEARATCREAVNTVIIRSYDALGIMPNSLAELTANAFNNGGISFADAAAAQFLLAAWPL